LLSELEYPMDGVLAEVRGSVPVFSRDSLAFKVRGRYASQLSYDGTTKDSDFVDFPGIRSDYSESDSEADVAIWDLDALVSLTPFAGEEGVLGSVELGLFAGYGSQTFDYTDNGLRYRYSYNTIVGSLPNSVEVSTYELEFTGPRAGVCASVNPLPGLRVSAEVVLIPDLTAKGDGDWKLRDYTFQQEADGDGLIISLKGSWRVMENLDVFAAYRSVEMIADKNGVESGVQEGVPYHNWPIVPEITGEYTGVEFGVCVLF